MSKKIKHKAPSSLAAMPDSTASRENLIHLINTTRVWLTRAISHAENGQSERAIKAINECGQILNALENKCSDLLECQQCGHKSKPEISWLGNAGVLWKVVVWCKVCKAAAQGKTREEAEKRFADGEYELEAL